MIDYDRKSGRIVEMKEFKDEDRDLANRTRLERELELHRDGINREVVLLQAPTLESIRKTHRRYFETLQQLAHLPENGKDFNKESD